MSTNNILGLIHEYLNTEDPTTIKIIDDIFLENELEPQENKFCLVYLITDDIDQAIEHIKDDLYNIKHFNSFRERTMFVEGMQEFQSEIYNNNENYLFIGFTKQELLKNVESFTDEQ